MAAGRLGGPDWGAVNLITAGVGIRTTGSSDDGTSSVKSDAVGGRGQREFSFHPSTTLPHTRVIPLLFVTVS